MYLASMMKDRILAHHNNIDLMKAIIKMSTDSAVSFSDHWVVLR